MNAKTLSPGKNGGVFQNSKYPPLCEKFQRKPLEEEGRGDGSVNGSCPWNTSPVSPPTTFSRIYCPERGVKAVHGIWCSSALQG